MTSALDQTLRQPERSAEGKFGPETEIKLKRSVFVSLAIALLVSPAWAQSSTTSNPDPDRFQIDVGYFKLESAATLRYAGPRGGSGEVSLERDLGQDPNVDTFWVDGTWRVGRRHQVKLSYTRLSRERGDYTLQRDFIWGGQTYNAGLKATSTSDSSLLGGYYRFAAVRNDKVELGPTLGLGYLSLGAGIKATGTIGGAGGSQSRNLDESKSVGSPTGALGGYLTVTPVRRLVLLGDFLYIKANMDNTEVAVKDWRLSANYYFFRAAGVGVQYKYNKYNLDRAASSAELGGEIEFQGFQAFLTFRF